MCWYDEDENLNIDGSDLFDPYWQTRCRDWLLERGHITQQWHTHSEYEYNETLELIEIECPAAEFCARAIHELMKDKQ